MRILSLLALLAAGSADRPNDLVKTVPGLKGDLPTRHWSGYIEADSPNGGTVNVHYWLVENANKDPKAPTVVWQNGGPGSSSLMGFMTENGPITVNDDSFNTKEYQESGVPTVFLNPHSWNNYANMLYVEHPAPTGFSYCSSPQACAWNDSSQAVANYNFYVAFFEAFPELNSNDFYIAGESYAGVLVPTVALQFLKHRTPSNKNTAPWSLKGFALGNDCPGSRVFTCTPYSGWIGTQTSVDFLYGHGMIKEETYNKINAACDGHWGTYEAPPEPCKTLLEDPTRPVMSEAGDTYNMGGGYYLYDNCMPDLMALNGKGSSEAPSREGALTRKALRDPYNLNSGEYACGQERGGHVWLNLPEVQQAIHVKLVDKKQFSWSSALNYTYTAWSLLKDYNDTLIPNFRIMQYTGDADPCVPYVGTQRWIDSLNLPITKNWRPWNAPNTMPYTGYVTEFASNFTFATVRNAGHMVPRYKPRESLYMFGRWLHGKEL